MADDPTVALWYHYEEIAMHFNLLLMQFRLQVLGGAGAIGTVASYLIGGKVKDQQRQNWLRALISTALFILVAGAATLDIWYYSRLLRGAVDALIDFEGRHPSINMSTTIDRTVGTGEWAPWVMYGGMLLTLFVFAALSWKHYFRTVDLDARAGVATISEGDADDIEPE